MSSAASSSKSWCAGCSSDCDVVCWVIRVVLLVYAAFVASNLPANVAMLFDNTIVRLVVVLLILALATCDPASAILLTIGFVLSIQTANKLHISKLANAAATGSAAREAFMDAIESAASAGKAASGAVGGAVSDVGDAVSATGHAAGNVVGDVGHAAGGVVSGAGHVVSDVGHAVGGGHHAQHGAHHAQHGARRVQHDAQPSASAFTSPQQLAAMQSNAVSNNQETEVRTWQQELGPQGLQQPSGFSFRDADAPAPFSAGPNCPPNQH